MIASYSEKIAQGHLKGHSKMLCVVSTDMQRCNRDSRRAASSKTAQTLELGLKSYCLTVVSQEQL